MTTPFLVKVNSLVPASPSSAPDSPTGPLGPISPSKNQVKMRPTSVKWYVFVVGSNVSVLVYLEDQR